MYLNTDNLIIPSFAVLSFSVPNRKSRQLINNMYQQNRKHLMLLSDVIYKYFIKSAAEENQFFTLSPKSRFSVVKLSHYSLGLVSILSSSTFVKKSIRTM
jgi:hypothetical protein